MPAGAVSGLGHHILLRWVPGYALHVVPVLCEAPLRAVLLGVPHHAHVLYGPRQQRRPVWRPGRIDDVIRMPRPAHPPSAERARPLGALKQSPLLGSLQHLDYLSDWDGNEDLSTTTERFVDSMLLFFSLCRVLSS